ncbi:hypothetical protein [Mesorhizobium loti]|uniref:hypothetical protein n=1 Tax=Rhizobium loti TaxID=381 RepID=UPI00047BD4AD|nr:hypothetical protein [Mesorhizobium loti]
MVINRLSCNAHIPSATFIWQGKATPQRAQACSVGDHAISFGKAAASASAGIAKSDILVQLDEMRGPLVHLLDTQFETAGSRLPPNLMRFIRGRY